MNSKAGQLTLPYFVVNDLSIKFKPKQADRAYGTGISPRLFVISFVILYVCNTVQYWYLTFCHYVSS